MLAALVRGKPIVVVSDEVYEHMVFDGASHESIAGHAELADQSVVIGSFGKTFHATGWKVGYALAPREITDELRRVHQFIVFTVNSAVQHALAAFLEKPERYESLPAFFAAKRDRLRAILAATPLTVLPCAGSYFQLARYDRISDEPARAFAERLIREIGVATIPLSAFYQDGTDHRVIRFCFAKRDETLDAAVSVWRSCAPESSKTCTATARETLAANAIAPLRGDATPRCHPLAHCIESGTGSA
jgi:methionine aminotransferase